MQHKSIQQQCATYVKGLMLHIKQEALTVVNTVTVSVAAAGNGPRPSWLDVNSLTEYERSRSPEAHMQSPIVWPRLEDGD